MTREIYEKLYRQSRNFFAKITTEQKRKIRQTFIEAADLAAEAVRQSTVAGLSSLTVSAYSQVQASLEAGATIIGRSLEEGIPFSITKAYGHYAEIDANYLDDAFKTAGVTGIVNKAGILNVSRIANLRLIAATVNRTYQDGYTFSDRIWSAIQKTVTRPDGTTYKTWIGVNGAYQDSIKQVVNLGIAQGRDVFEIAEDIQIYAADGKVQLMKRYGKLKAGTAEFRRRIPKNVDWRAVRLVRSELYASLQQASIEQGRINPAASGWYDWKLTIGAQHRCVCPKLADASPYKEEDIPGYPHSNCLCYIIPTLRNQNDVVADLKSWLADPSSQPDLETWYQTVYREGQV